MQCINLELWTYDHYTPTIYEQMTEILKGKKIMGRHLLCRRVRFMPSVTFFKPAGIPLRELDEVCISVEELEAIRLKDIEDLEQEQCADKMNISRTTFVRILDAARKKMADAFIKGKAIRIEGGHFEMVGTPPEMQLQPTILEPGCRRHLRRGRTIRNHQNTDLKKTTGENGEVR
jgi:uncharacterized protein